MSSSYLPDLLFVTAPLHSSCNKNPYQQNLVFSGGDMEIRSKISIVHSSV